METTKHTPGPWKLDGQTVSIPVLNDKAGAELIRVFLDKEPGTAKANAKLIASAPELLDTLKRIHEAVMENEDDLNNIPIDALKNSIQSAIKKATSTDKPEREDYSGKVFPNGIRSWSETFYEIVDHLTCSLVRNDKNKLAQAAVAREGRTALYDLAEELTDEFEKLFTGMRWGIDEGGEFLEAIDKFLADKEKEHSLKS